MPELVHTRDCVVLIKGDTIPVVVSDDLVQSGWLGVQGVSWTVADGDNLTVAPTDGNACGFLLWGSDESSDRYTSMTRNQPYYRFATLGFGGWMLYTSTYERYTYASRQSGPLVPLTYYPNDRLYFSLRGYFTKEDEWTLSSDPRAPNPWVIAAVVHVPSVLTGTYLGVQTAI